MRGQYRIFSLIANSKYKDATIIALEPEKSNFDMLVMNCKKFPNIIPIIEGIWNRNTYLKLVNGQRGTLGNIFEESDSVEPYYARGINELKK